MQTLNKNEGLITQIVGPVIDVEFQQGELPEIYNALKIYNEDGSAIMEKEVFDHIEELVGEIYDEYDEEATEIRQTEDGSYRVNASSNIDDFFEFFDLIVDGDEYDANTVGGWVCEKLGELPQIGKEFTFYNLKISVTKSTRKKLIEVKVTVLSEKELEELTEEEIEE